MCPRAPARATRAPLALLVLALALLLLAFVSADATALQDSQQREDRRFFSNLFNRNPLRTDSQAQSCSCTCGESNVDGRIVGGEPAKTNEFPWIVRLTYFNRFYCDGMLINDRYVLTAAHCIKGFMWFMIKVTFGEHDRCDKNAKPETRFVLRAVTGDFSYLNFEHDIAILRLNDKVPITDTIRPICLPKNSNNLYVGHKAIVSGWGTLQEDGKPACILQQVEVPVMSNDECKKTKYKKEMISDNMLCAGYPEGQKDSCQGDSGGPLIREKPDKRYELIGVVSWGNGCARPGYPGIYTRVTRYLDWIRNNTADGCWCGDDPEPSVTPLSTTVKPSTSRPTMEKPTTKKPTTTMPTTAKPTTAMPTTTQPSTTQPTSDNMEVVVEVDKVPETPNKKPTEEAANEPEKQPTEEPEKQPTEEPEKQPTEEPEKQPAEEPDEQPAEEPAQQPAGEPEKPPAEEPEKEQTLVTMRTPTADSGQRVIGGPEKPQIEEHNKVAILQDDEDSKDFPNEELRNTVSKPDFTAQQSPEVTVDLKNTTAETQITPTDKPEKQTSHSVEQTAKQTVTITKPQTSEKLTTPQTNDD